jgi:cell division protein FtsQ
LKPEKSRLLDSRNLKKIGWIALTLIFFMLIGASIAEANLKEFSNLYIKIDYDKGLFFIDEEEIKRKINDYCHGELASQPLKKVDLAEIEERLEANPFIQQAEVYSSTKGAIHVDVRQREPLVRVVNNSGVSYYLDVNGLKIPTSSK